MAPVPDDLAPIIVGGCHRSGTSLVRRILDAHPRIYCGPEVKFFRDFHGDYLKDPVRHLRFMESARSLLPADELLDLLGSAFVEMHERAARRAGKPRWADKSPENVVFLDEWERLLGDRWVLLHVVRNPLDTIASITESPFPHSLPAELDARIDLYLEYTRAGFDFGEANPDRYVQVVYEVLVSDPEATLATLMDRLGEELHRVQLRMNDVPHQDGLEDPKVAGTSRIHGSSVGRWREVLTAEEATKIRARTAELWRRIESRRH